MKTLVLIICSLFLSAGAFAQGEKEYSKVSKNKTVRARPKSVNSRSNPPDMVVLRRQAKPQKPNKDRFQHHDRTAFNSKMERKQRGTL